jgi:hypothetical protein
VPRKDIPSMPPFLPSLKMKADECSSYIMDNLPDNYSKRDVSDLAAKFYSRLISEKDYPELFL